METHEVPQESNENEDLKYKESNENEDLKYEGEGYSLAEELWLM